MPFSHYLEDEFSNVLGLDFIGQPPYGSRTVGHQLITPETIEILAGLD